jgi:hypothetical protein
MGIFTDVSWSFGYIDAEVDILGRFGPAAIEYVGASVVSGTASGWRVVNYGALASGLLPTLDQLLNWGPEQDVILEIQDRTTGKDVTKITNVKMLSYETGVANKNLSTVRVAFKGIGIEEDTIVNSENGSNPATLPSA